MIIDNENNTSTDRITMADHIKNLCKNTKNLDIGVGYFYKDGFDKISECLDVVDNIRIIMGTQTSQETVDAIYNPDTPLGKKYKDGKIKIKIWDPAQHDEKNFHGKTWIFHEINTAIIGSSNCSINGLEQSKELNITINNLDEITKWYKDAWNKAQIYDPKLLEIRIINKVKVKIPKKMETINKGPQTLWNYQKDAVNRVTKELQGSNKCKLIMACGTGKTLTSIRIMERMMKSGDVCVYFVPSISLIPQTLSQFQQNGIKKCQYHAVCSDKHAGKVEDDVYSNLNIPSSTEQEHLVEALKTRNKKFLFVIFTVYNSWQVAVDGLKKANITSKLALYDEAHRTTGKRDGFAGNALKELKAEKKVFMTATPRVYKDSSSKDVNSMDDENIYGRDAYRLGFTEAVKLGKLVDFKITLPEFKEEDRKGDKIDWKDKRLAVWEGIQYPNGTDQDFKFLQRMIVFHSTIKSSKVFSNSTGQNKLLGEKAEKLAMEKIVPSNSKYKIVVKHVDSNMSANERRKEIEWIKESNEEPKECRILSNARCLQEGVDIPALDAVVFLDPKKSPVDIIQAIGRVMRKDDNKEHGYVILPIPMFKGYDTESQMNKNSEYRMISNVCSAILAHDDKLASLLNQTFLINGGMQGSREGERTTKAFEEYLKKLIDNANPKLLDYVRTVMLDLVDRSYYPRYGKKLGLEAKKLEGHVKNLTTKGRSHEIMIKFHKELQSLINDSITMDDAIQVLCQHKVLKPVFDLLFSKSTSDNSVSAELDKTLKSLDLVLPNFDHIYDSIEKELENITDQAVKQEFIRNLYDSFFKGADEKAATKHGIVYTPVAVVDFINNSVQHVLKTEFNTNFSDKGVKVIDPFTGTGMFITRLLQSGLISKDKLEYKYKNDIYANDIILLAYYTAQANIETTYSGIKNKYEPFGGISYVDTLAQNPFYRLDKKYQYVQRSVYQPFVKSYKRLGEQNKADLCVIIGNPPYSGGQKNANEANKNTKHVFIEERVKNTYGSAAPTANLRGLYNSYIKALRWSTDRIGESGIVGLIIPKSFIVGNIMAGVRKCLYEDFTDIYILDLLGDAKLLGDARQRQGGNIFGSGSREPICIVIFIKNVDKKKHEIHYKQLTEYLSTEQKLDNILQMHSIGKIKDWEDVIPNEYYDWLNQRGNEDETFKSMMQIGSKDAKRNKTDKVLFQQYKNGLTTGRDAWTYNSSISKLSNNMKKCITYCNKHYKDKKFEIDPKQAKWTEGSAQQYKRLKTQSFILDKIRDSLYRPFFKQYLYFDNVFNERPSVGEFYPDKTINNSILLPYQNREGVFSTLMSDAIPDVNVISPTQCIPSKKSTPPPINYYIKNPTIICPDKINVDFSVLMTKTLPDSSMILHGQCFPMKVMKA